MTTKVISDALRAFAFCRKHFAINRTDQQKGICLMRDGAVDAACVYDEFNGSNVFVHIAATPGKRWLTRSFLYWAFHYPFEQLGCKRMTAWINSDNVASVTFVEHLGFELEATLKQAGPTGGDVLLYVMFREKCRYV